MTIWIGWPQNSSGSTRAMAAPVGQDVAHTRRAAEVVLEDAELAVLVADDVDPGNVDPHAVRRVEPVRRPDEIRAKLVTTSCGTMPSLTMRAEP